MSFCCCHLEIAPPVVEEISGCAPNPTHPDQEVCGCSCCHDLLDELAIELVHHEPMPLPELCDYLFSGLRRRKAWKRLSRGEAWATLKHIFEREACAKRLDGEEFEACMAQL